jgi:hypothetical protein
MNKLNNQKGTKLEDYGTVYWYKFADILAYNFNKIPYMSPNLITTLRNLVLIRLCYKVFYKKNFTNLGMYVLVIGILDCVDGEYARKYNKVTKFGDNYDHISDLITTLVLFTILFMYSETKYSLIIALIFLFTASQQMICMERYRKKYMNINTDRDSLQFLDGICPAKSKKGLESFLTKYRFLGYGTYYMVMTILMSKLNRK